MATGFLVVPCTLVSHSTGAWKLRRTRHCPRMVYSMCHLASSSFSCLYSSAFCGVSYPLHTPYVNDNERRPVGDCVVACLPPLTSHSASPTSTKLYISGLSFRTTEESLRNAFAKFGQLVEVNLVMDKIAKRPRGFAFISYATGDESKKAIEGMHGKFLDGRVIFVEVAKPRTEVRKNNQNYR